MQRNNNIVKKFCGQFWEMVFEAGAKGSFARTAGGEPGKSVLGREDKDGARDFWDGY